MKAYRGFEVQLYIFIRLYMEVGDQFLVPDILPPEREPSATHWKGGWMGRQPIPDPVEKSKMSCPCRETNPNSSVA
jgi:hypothetical protein